MFLSMLCIALFRYQNQNSESEWGLLYRMLISDISRLYISTIYLKWRAVILCFAL